MEERYTNSHKDVEKPAPVRGLVETEEDLKIGFVFNELRNAIVKRTREILCQEIVADDDIIEAHDLLVELRTVMQPRHFRAIKKL